MAMPEKDMLLTALNKLDEKSFVQFKTKLSTWNVKKKYERIPSTQLEDADQQSVADLIMKTYGTSYGIKVSLAVLDAINEKKVREELLQESTGAASPAQGLCQYRSRRPTAGQSAASLEPKVVYQSLSLPARQSGRNHFLDKNQKELIKKIKNIDSVLYDLLDQHLLTKQEYTMLRQKPGKREEGKMRSLCDMIQNWSFTDKDKVYDILRRHNDEELEALEQSHIPFSHQSETRLREETPEWEGLLFPPAPTTSSSHPSDSSPDYTQDMSSLSLADQNTEAVSFRHHECRLCGKAQKHVSLVDPEKTENTYRLKIESRGNFCCSETGLAFLVNGAVTIEYNLEPWSNHFGGIQLGSYEIIGPLFNINVDDSTKVVILYLPHNLCLKAFNGEEAQIKCAHFSHGNLSLKTPDRIEPFYMVVYNPTFSPWGSLLQLIKKQVPIHGIVLIYFKILGEEGPEYKEYKINLYFVTNSLHTEKDLDKRKTHHGFHRLEKPPQTIQTVYTKTKYDVHGDPKAFVNPKTLQLQTHYQTEHIPFTEISIKEKEKDLSIYVSQQDTREIVWQTVITMGDVQEIMQKKRRLSDLNREHFVIRHRADLISRVSLPDPILDELKSHHILSDEEYSAVRSEQTSQNKMRKLFDFVRSWGIREMDTLYKALRKNNGPLIRDLEENIE